jgi:hypothetical protein
MLLQGINQGPEQRTRLSDPVGERRSIQIHALAGIDLALPVQRQVIYILRYQHVSQKSGTREPPGDRAGGCRRLNDLLTGRAAELRAHMADHLEPRRHVLEDLGEILAKGPQSPATGGAVARRLVHDCLTRQALRQPTARRFGFFSGRLGVQERRGLSRARFEFLEAEFELRDGLVELFGGSTELHAL